MLEPYPQAAIPPDRSQQLIAELQLGSSKEDVFRQLFHLHYRPILIFFVRRGAFTFQECEELTQETLLRVYRGADSFRHEVSFKSWLFRIAANVYRSALKSRSAAKREGQEVPLDYESGEGTARPIPAPVPDPLADVLDRERQLRLRQAMRMLPEQMQRCVTLRIVSDLKYREIAEVMQISIQTVKAHLSQARVKLRESLSEGSEEAALNLIRD